MRRLAPAADVVVIVDVLSFSTAVDIAVARGAVVLPYRWHDGSEAAFAEANGAVLAARRPGRGELSLRPSSLVGIDNGTRLVLPSPNGSALTFAASTAGAVEVIVGSLRNATAIGRSLSDRGRRDVAVIAAGERWRGTTGPLRPAIEDLLGAGAVLVALDRSGVDRSRSASPEARVAMAAFADARSDLVERLRTCGSGRELIGRGFGADVELAAAADVSAAVPTLRGIELVDGTTAR